MAICSLAIESSTDEIVWVPSERSSVDRARLLWIQSEQSVSDQSFDSYAILGGTKPYILTSRRVKNLWSSQRPADDADRPVGAGARMRDWIARLWWEALTMLGVVLGSFGFITQFIGLRGLAWPVAVSQLIAILVRALVRRNLGIIPLACRALKGHELDFLAIRIVFCRQFCEFEPEKRRMRAWQTRNQMTFIWRVATVSLSQTERFQVPLHDKHVDFETESLKSSIAEELEIPEDAAVQSAQLAENHIATVRNGHPSSSQQLVKVRQRLEDLCKWNNSASEVALALTRVIEHAMNVLLHGTALEHIVWKIQTTRFSEASHRKPTEAEEFDYVEVSLQKNTKGWSAEIGRIEAILSLWVTSIEKSAANVERSGLDRPANWRRSRADMRSKTKYCRLIGDGDDAERLRRDSSWWIGEYALLEDGIGTKTEADSATDDGDITIGFDTPRGNLCLIPQTSTSFANASLGHRTDRFAQDYFASSATCFHKFHLDHLQAFSHGLPSPRP